MATSNSVNFSQTRNELIADVLVSLGVYRPGATISSADYSFCANKLNKMLKSWEAQGIHLWTLEEGVLFLTVNKSTYTLSASTTDKIGRDAIQTQLDGDASGTSLTVVSTVGMTAADNIGICLDDNTIQWTTIVSVDSSTTITITTGLTSAASSGNSVYTYTTAVGRPLYIKTARLMYNSGVERPLNVDSKIDFMDYPNKQTAGEPLAISYSPKTSTGLLYVHPLPNDVNQSVRFSYIRTIQDLDNSTDDFDLPQEWLLAIDLGLQALVAKTYGKDKKDSQELRYDAEKALLQAQLFDVDEGSTYIGPKDSYDE